MSNTESELDSVHESNDNELKLHLAEYQALTHRSTGLIGQMFAVMTIGFAYLGFLINNWVPLALDHRQILWPGLLVEQIIILFWSALRHAELEITLYINTTLRALCGVNVPAGASFWKYRTFMKKNATLFDGVSLWLPMLASIGAFLGVMLYRCVYAKVSWAKWEFWPTVVSAMLTAWAIRGSHNLYKMKKTLNAKLPAD